jgi:hypothetical protein
MSTVMPVMTVGLVEVDETYGIFPKERTLPWMRGGGEVKLFYLWRGLCRRT